MTQVGFVFDVEEVMKGLVDPEFLKVYEDEGLIKAGGLVFHFQDGKLLRVSHINVITAEPTEE
jgi:hypothetical protein